MIPGRGRNLGQRARVKVAGKQTEALERVQIRGLAEKKKKEDIIFIYLIGIKEFVYFLSLSRLDGGKIRALPAWESTIPYVIL